MGTHRSSNLAPRAAGLVGIGALAALLAELSGARGHGAPTPPGPLAWWAADRDAGALFGLDRELYVERRVELVSPIALIPAEGAGVFVLSAAEGRRTGLHQLLRLDGAGRVEWECELSCAARLVPLADGGLLCLSADPAAAPVRYSRAGLPGDFEHRLPAGEGSAVDLAQAEDGRGWWMLTRGLGHRLLRLDGELAVAWSAETGVEALRLAPLPGEERAWVLDPRAAELALIGSEGPELRLRDPGLTGAADLSAGTSGEVVVAAPGALLRFDRRGRRLPGQGGFHLLTGLARASPAPLARKDRAQAP